MWDRGKFVLLTITLKYLLAGHESYRHINIHIHSESFVLCKITESYLLFRSPQLIQFSIITRERCKVFAS